jgi:hypothetical protein
MFIKCSVRVMRHAMPIPALSPACASFATPGAWTSPFRFIPARRPEPWWREALRWSLMGLVASWAAGEATLWLSGL